MLISSPSLTLCLMAVVSTFPMLISSNPVPISPRSQVCTNAPKTIAGTPLHRRTTDLEPLSKPVVPISPSLQPRSNLIWCVPGTQTFLSLHITSTVIPVTVLPVLNDAYNSVYAHLHSIGDGELPGGRFVFADHMMVLNVWNSNNHQITWGVLGAALWGLRDFMEEMNVWGSAVFQVFDGLTWDGSGMLGMSPKGGAMV